MDPEVLLSKSAFAPVPGALVLIHQVSESDSMPLARIITRTPAQLAALSEYLRARGYTVELVEPGTLRTSPAELEMNLEGCTAGQALSRGVSAAEGAQQGRQRRAIAYDITGRPVAFADEEEEEEERPARTSRNAIPRVWGGLASAWREVLENLRLSAGHLREWIAEGRQTIEERRLRKQEERAEALAEKEQALAEKERERQTRALAREEERSRRQAMAERTRRSQEDAARQAAIERARREQQEVARREEWAERERQLMERYRQEARRDVVQERFQAEQGDAQQQVTPAEAQIGRREVQPTTPRYLKRDNDWKKAAVGAIVIALLATLGYAAYENRQPAAPLSNRALVRSQNVSQPVPFGAATVAPFPATTSAPSNAKLPQSDVTPKAPAAPKPSARIRRVRRARVADDTVAGDEVVIHHAPATKTSSRTAASNQPKHISDLDQ